MALPANSSFTAAQISALGEIEAEIIPYGWTVKGPLDEMKNITHSFRPKEILFVGRLIERKGVEFLVRAMPKIIAQTDARLLIIGEGDQAARICSIA